MATIRRPQTNLSPLAFRCCLTLVSIIISPLPQQLVAFQRTMPPVQGPLLPPPPSLASLEALARSPASSMLATDFFALERQRHSQMPPSQTSANSRQRPLIQAASAPAAAPLPSPAPLPLEISSSMAEFSSSLDGSLRLDQYHTLDEIYNFIDELPNRYKNVQVFTIGKSSESRPIKALELINNSTDPDYIWLDALTHAREWITGSTLLYIIDQLVANGSGNNGRSSNMVTKNRNSAMYNKNYIIIPVVNPDGYSYTWSHNRMWRKNRSRSPMRAPDSKCIGADLNRNFDHAFGGEGSSSDPCSHIYSGAFPFSEPETKSMADLLWSLKDRVKFYLTIHSFNQLWACPYAHSKEPSASLQKHMRVLRSIQRAVFESEGVRYEIGPLSTSLYVGSGFGIDFAYDKCGIEHSYLVELRDKGLNGFVLPPDQIMPTARETLAGLKAGLRVVFGGH